VDGGEALAELSLSAAVSAPIVTTTPAPNVAATIFARALIAGVFLLREFIWVSSCFVIVAANRGPVAADVVEEI
jgi:hypothetical protein